MVKSKKNQDFYWHEDAGTRILLPSQLSVQHSFPELYAKQKRGFMTIFIEITSDEISRVTAERMIQAPPTKSDQLSSEVLCKGAVTHPFDGIEKIWEERVVGQPVVIYGWNRVLYLDKPSGIIADIQIQGKGEFRDVESMWQQVMDSFSWKGSTAMGPECTDNENVSRISPPQKKQTKNVPLLKLPSSLSYLQPAMDELMTLPEEEIYDNLDLPILHQLLEERIQGLPLADAEECLSNDRAELEAWCEEDPVLRSSAGFIIGILLAFEFSLGERDDF